MITVCQKLHLPLYKKANMVQCKPITLPERPDPPTFLEHAVLIRTDRSEFYVRFKGPTESEPNRYMFR